jgi:glutathione synthase/RimK-type ligase-like ATP-grasp enzyme
MILLWGLPGDGPLAAVHATLRARHEPVYLLDQRAIGATTLDLSVGPTVRGTLRLGDDLVALEAVTAVYARPYDVRQLPALVINRPSAMASNGSKPYQAELIRDAGLDVPDTLVTTNPTAALAFAELHGSVIYKSTSGVRSIVSRLGPEHHGRLTDIGNCPTQFQQYISGTDCRVHVVGNTVFAAEIISDADDYRYAGRTGHSTDIRACTLEPQLAERCCRLADELDLPVAGIDLRRTPEGHWYCFEVNPSPGFTFYQEATGQKIAEAVASLLASGRSI